MCERTKKLRKKKNIFFFISTALWIGTALFFVFSGLAKISDSRATTAISQEVVNESTKASIVSLGTTLLIGVVLAIVIKDKIRNTIWMASLVVGSIIYGSTAMYITLAIWGIDEYVIYALYRIYKNKYIINKEIDLR